MTKKNKNKAKHPLLDKGQELIYSDGKTLMEKTSVLRVIETGYELANGMKIDFSFNRTDGRKKKDSHESFTIATEESLQIFEAYFLQKKNIQDLGAIIKSMQSIDKMNLTLNQAEGIIKASKYINKIKSTLE